MNPPTTIEEWKELFWVHKNMSGCGCCAPNGDAVDAVNAGVATIVPRPSCVPEYPSWSDMSPEAKVIRDTIRRETDLLRVKWANRLTDQQVYTS